jgi:hypothetical protein
MLERIAGQVRQHLHEPGLVRQHGGQVGRGGDGEAMPRRRERLGAARCDRGGIDGPDGHPEPAELDPRF